MTVHYSLSEGSENICLILSIFRTGTVHVGHQYHISLSLAEATSY